MGASSRPGKPLLAAGARLFVPLPMETAELACHLDGLLGLRLTEAQR